MGLNGALVDVAITLEMKFGNLAAGATATKVFYTSLNGKQNGNDMTLGGNCADILNAGRGNGLFVFSKGRGVDIITGFTTGAATNDAIDKTLLECSKIS